MLRTLQTSCLIGVSHPHRVHNMLGSTTLPTPTCYRPRPISMPRGRISNYTPDLRCQPHMCKKCLPDMGKPSTRCLEQLAPPPLEHGNTAKSHPGTPTTPTPTHHPTRVNKSCPAKPQTQDASGVRPHHRHRHMGTLARHGRQSLASLFAQP